MRPIVTPVEHAAVRTKYHARYLIFIEQTNRVNERGGGGMGWDIHQTKFQTSVIKCHSFRLA